MTQVSRVDTLWGVYGMLMCLRQFGKDFYYGFGPDAPKGLKDQMHAMALGHDVGLANAVDEVLQELARMGDEKAKKLLDEHP